MAGQIVRRGERKFVVRVYAGTDPQIGNHRYVNKTINGKRLEWCTIVVEKHLRPFFGAIKATDLTSDTSATSSTDTTKASRTAPSTGNLRSCADR